MLRSFREYLCREYKNQPEGQRLDEAKYGQAPRKSYQFDAEDIDFLKQFNHSLWAQAHHQRMELLFDNNRLNNFQKNKHLNWIQHLM